MRKAYGEADEIDEKISSDAFRRLHDTGIVWG
jgi:hypothetical protein